MRTCNDMGTMGCRRAPGQGAGQLRVLYPLLGLLVLLGMASPAAAQGWVEPLRPVPGGGVVRLSTDVTVEISGRVAEVVVEEWFENRGGGLGEGDYLYPLPGEAVFSNFSLYQGDQELRGETMDAAEARGIYEEIVRSRRDPALIELMGHGLIRARVFPIEPGQRRRITLRYTQLLERSGESVQFRYAAGGRNAGRAPVTGRVPVDFTLIADTAAYAEPFSPTHRLEVERRGGVLRVQPGADLTGDLSVFLPVVRDGVGITVAAYRTDAEAGYFMLTLSPGTRTGAGTPRDVTAVVDVSGSMSGEKLEQTRQALHQLLGSLGPRDRFRLLAFSNRVRSSGDGWSSASATELELARDWVDDLRADGGTNMGDALAEALRLESPDDRLPIIVFLTDGLPTVGERDPERIAATAEARRGRARIFAFGVGYDVNTYLLDRLGRAGRGSTGYVQPDEDVERALATLAGKITHPVLTDLRLDGAPVRLTEIYPGELPDLFAGEELVVFGRYEGHGAGPLRIVGRRAGRDERFAVDATFPARAGTNDYVPRLWASRKLGELTREIRLNGASEELVAAVRETALRYGLLSDYTSYLVQEPGITVTGGTGGARRLLRTQAPPPADAEAATVALQSASGEAAVKASARARAFREVATAADLAAVEEEQVAAGPSAQGIRIVAGRTFQFRDGTWLDAAVARDGAAAEGAVETVAVAVYSSAYFDLLEALPELRALAELEGTVVVAGAEVNLRFGDDGAKSLPPRAVRRLVALFRG